MSIDRAASETSLRAAHESARASFAVAANAEGELTRNLRIGGRLVRLQVAGETLDKRIAPAFAHLETGIDTRDAPALTVFVWASAASGAPWPVAVPDAPHDDPEGTRLQSDDGTRRVCCWPHRRVVAAHDATTGEAWWWIADGRDAPWWEAAAPLRIVLHWWAIAEGCRLVHGGAVGFPEAGALIVGRGGAGKSTFSLACLRSRMRYAGDDYVWLEPGAPPIAHSLYATAKVVPSGAWRVPHVCVRPTTGAPDEKLVVDVHAQFPDRIATTLPLRVVLLPSISGGRARLSPALPGEAFRALATSTVLQVPDTATPGTLALLARLLEGSDVYRLELGDDLEAAVALVEELLAGLRGTVRRRGRPA